MFVGNIEMVYKGQEKALVCSLADIKSCASNQKATLFRCKIIRHWVAAIQIRQMPA